MKTFKIDGYHVVLSKIRNVYPVASYNEKETLFEWGFKYDDGFYEQFIYDKKDNANRDHDKFVTALSITKE